METSGWMMDAFTLCYHIYSCHVEPFNNLLFMDVRKIYLPVHLLCVLSHEVMNKDPVHIKLVCMRMLLCSSTKRREEALNLGFVQNVTFICNFLCPSSKRYTL